MRPAQLAAVTLVMIAFVYAITATDAQQAGPAQSEQNQGTTDTGTPTPNSDDTESKGTSETDAASAQSSTSEDGDESGSESAPNNADQESQPDPSDSDDPDAAAADTNETKTDSEKETDEAASEATSGTAKTSKTAAGDKIDTTTPLLRMAVGVAIVLGLIIGFKVNAFIALITAAMVVSLISPGALSDKISRVASAFGSYTGGIGIVIAMAAVIGKCMLDSGAADRIVRAFLKGFGEKRSPLALMFSGFVLAVPVFFDTVFYLLVPLARSLYRKTQKNYLYYILAIGAGGAITHTLVPPTPGPLLMAENLNIDIGWMIMVGALIALPSALAGLIVAKMTDGMMPIPMRKVGNEEEPKPLADDELPSLLVSLLPVLLPVVLISSNTVLSTLADSQQAAAFKSEQVEWDALQVTMQEQWNAWQDETDTVREEGPNNPTARVLQHPAMQEVKDLLVADSGTAKRLKSDDKDKLVVALNSLILDKELYTEQAFLGVRLTPVAKANVNKSKLRMNRATTQRMNRAVLESAYPTEIEAHVWETSVRKAANVSSMLGNANLVLLLSTVIAMWTLAVQRGLGKDELAKSVEVALMSGGVIILITAGGGAFGSMLSVAQVGPAIKEIFSSALGEGNSGMVFIMLGFLIAFVLKVAQGSSTVAMIVGSSMMASIVGTSDLGFSTVYLATAIGGGSLVGSWMNDSGFWIFAKMGGLTETEALKTWTVLLVVMGFVSLAMSLLLANVLPLV